MTDENKKNVLWIDDHYFIVKNKINTKIEGKCIPSEVDFIKQESLEIILDKLKQKNYDLVIVDNDADGDEKLGKGIGTMDKIKSLYPAIPIVYTSCAPASYLHNLVKEKGGALQDTDWAAENLSWYLDDCVLFKPKTKKIYEPTSREG